MFVPTAHIAECLPTLGKSSARQGTFCQFAANLTTKTDDITSSSSVGTVLFLESDKGKHDAHRNKLMVTCFFKFLPSTRLGHFLPAVLAHLVDRDALIVLETT